MCPIVGVKAEDAVGAAALALKAQELAALALKAQASAKCYLPRVDHLGRRLDVADAGFLPQKFVAKAATWRTRS